MKTGVLNRTINALQISQDLHARLLANENIQLRVHSTFRHAVNILCPAGELMTIAKSAVDMMPMGMIVDLPVYSSWPFEVDDYLEYNGQMEFVFLNNKKGVIRFRNARLWRPTLHEPTGEVSLPTDEALHLIKSTLEELDTGGIASIIRFVDKDARDYSQCTNIYARFIMGDLCSFLETVEERKWDLALRQAELLVGFGPGLTPSCDDFLNAFLLSLYYDNLWHDRDDVEVQSFIEGVLNLARTRTTIVSYSMLKHASEGRASDSYLKILKTLSTPNLPELHLAIKRVLEFGATSGADFLFGIWCVQMILARWAQKEAH